MQHIFVINKPKGPTSHDIIEQLRKITGIRKIGHAGTLDPLASGILVVGIGREGTKKLGEFVRSEKEYLATIKLGETSETDDAEGILHKYTNSTNCTNSFRSHREESPTGGRRGDLDRNNIDCFADVRNDKKIDINIIKNILKQFIGKIEQIPPIYSAIKIHGKPAHRRVRAGEEIKLKSRNVTIKSIDIINYQWPILKIKVICGSGVYIRSLARDIGEKLGVGGYLAELERTRVGKYTKKNITLLNQIKIN